MSDELRAIQLYLHPTRREALTATEKAITRWSLETDPATVLARLSTDPESLFSFSYSATAQVLFSGGITGSPDGLLFAHQQLMPDKYRSPNPGVIEWRNWDDLSVARASTVPRTCGDFGSLACSQDGRWLVLEGLGQRSRYQGIQRFQEMIFLLDWQTGEMLSRHAIGATSLTFDTTSTFVAGADLRDDNSIFPRLWRIDPAECLIPRPTKQDWSTGEIFQYEEISGNMALTPLALYNEPTDPILYGAASSVKFSPDSHIIIFTLNALPTPYESASSFQLEAYEVASGKRLWYTRNAAAATSQAIFSPDSRIILVPELGGDLLVYRAEDGALVQRLPTGLSEPVRVLAFDHDGKTLWLATEEELVQYQPQR